MIFRKCEIKRAGEQIRMVARFDTARDELMPVYEILLPDKSPLDFKDNPPRTFRECKIKINEYFESIGIKRRVKLN